MRTIALSVFLALTACGGGGSDVVGNDDASTNTQPVNCTTGNASCR